MIGVIIVIISQFDNIMIYSDDFYHYYYHHTSTDRSVCSKYQFNGLIKYEFFGFFIV